MTRPKDLVVSSWALEDQTVVITGTLENLTLKEAEDLVVEAGGKVGKTVTENTDVVIAGGKAGSELAKAKELEIPIRREKDLIKFIDSERPGGLLLVPAEPETDHEPDWEDELVKGEVLKECAQQLISNNSPEDVALVLGYKYMDGKGHPQPLVGHLFKAMEEAGVDLDEDEMSTDNMVHIWKGKLIRMDDWHGIKIHLPKKVYDESPQEYDHATDWEELEDWDETWEYKEPMMEGDVTRINYVDNDLEYSDYIDPDETLEYYDIPSKHIVNTMRYG